jgi:hypothetical protein
MGIEGGQHAVGVLLLLEEVLMVEQNCQGNFECGCLKSDQPPHGVV